jgi:hypothetical protein
LVPALLVGAASAITRLALEHIPATRSPVLQLHLALHLNLLDMTALPPVMEPIAITRSFAAGRLPDGVELASLTTWYLPLLYLCGDHLNPRTNPLNIIKGYLPLNRYILMIPLLPIHFPNRTRNDAVIADCWVQTGFDTKLH